jgi:hypothetical protein
MLYLLFRLIMAGYKKLDAMIETVQEERSGKIAH